MGILAAASSVLECPHCVEECDEQITYLLQWAPADPMTIYLHAGTHKTGTKSLQSLLSDNRGMLMDAGYDLYTGCHRNPRNHTELHLASLRKDRDSFSTHRLPGFLRDDSYHEHVKRHVARFLSGTKCRHQIFTNEDLSYLRHADEFSRLRSLFGTSAEIHVLLVFRNKSDFIRSYIAQIMKFGFSPSSNPQSALYVDADSWLMDYDALISGFKNDFGASVSVIDYDKSVESEGTVLPAILRTMGVDPTAVLGTGRFLHRSPAHISPPET